MSLGPIRLLIPAALLLPAAARGQQPNFPSGRSGPAYEVNLPGGAVWVRLDTVSASVMAPGDRATVFRAAVQVFKALKIRTDVLDSARAEVGSLNLVESRSFAGRRMSSWLRCGESITGPNADTWRIYMAVVSGVEPVGPDSSRVRTLLTATARNMAGGSSTPVRCATTGLFEIMVGHRIAEELGKAG